MSSRRNSDETVEIEIDVEGDSLEIERERIENVRIDRLFQPVESGRADARLQLWSDSAGWSGYECRDGEFYHVNVLTETTVRDDRVVVESTYIHEEQVPPEDVAESVRDHVLDGHAGSVGTFVRGCSPP